MQINNKNRNKILVSPEADPAVLLAWVETEEDLTAIHNAAKVIKMIMMMKMIMMLPR